jgi:hypothetical protein
MFKYMYTGTLYKTTIFHLVVFAKFQTWADHGLNTIFYFRLLIFIYFGESDTFLILCSYEQ